jgi:hypothetical protein
MIGHIIRLFLFRGPYSAPNRSLLDSAQRRLFASGFTTMSLSWFHSLAEES